MDTFLTVLSWATPPIVGALIGYATNRIAIKMLFRPLEPKYLVRWRIPLTPGVIPRNREDLAESIGTAVGGELLSEEAIRDYVDDPELRSAVEGMIPRPLGFSKPVVIRVLRALLGELRKRIDVPKLVEGRVNEYDIHDMERMILDVTERHLRWISWFGALLGALVGCLQVLLSVLI